MGIGESVIGSVCLLTFAAGLSWIGGLMIFAPMYEATALFRADSRFRLSDVVVLALLLQVAFAILIAPLPAEAVQMRGVLIVNAVLLLLFWWANGVRMLSRAGVRRASHRWLFLGLMIPFGYVSVVVIPPAALMVVPLALQATVLWGRGDGGDDALAAIGVTVVLVAAVGIATACHRGSRRLTLEAREDQARGDGIEFGDFQSHKRPPRPPALRTVRADQQPDPEGVWLDDAREKGEPTGGD